MEEITCPGPKQDYKVFVRTITYNQSKYITDTLEGVAMQQTDFPFVHFVIDDASTDGEQEVIKTWMNCHCEMTKAEFIDIDLASVILVPHKTNPNCNYAFYFLKRNLYKEPDLKQSLYKPWRDHCQYEALCEGDDYWTDPLKLQKQVDFMEAHPEYSMCFHNVMVLDQQDQQLKPDTITIDVPSVTDVYYLCKNGNYIHTPSILYRQNAKVDAVRAKMGQLIVGDIVSHVLHAQYGKIYKFSECMAVYRKGVGIWTSDTVRQEFRKFEKMRSLSKLAVAVEDPELKKIIDAKVTEVRNDFLYLHKDYEIAIHSLSYRLGNTILYPFIWLRNFFLSRKS